jgi:hypothetical protein
LAQLDDADLVLLAQYLDDAFTPFVTGQGT